MFKLLVFGSALGLVPIAPQQRSRQVRLSMSSSSWGKMTKKRWEKMPKVTKKELPAIAVTSSCLTFAVVAKVPKNLFMYHPLLGALVIPTTTMATLAVRSRLRAARLAQESKGNGREVLKKRVQVHFAFSATATVAAFGAVSAIFANKQRLAKSHFVSVHAKCGLCALLLWLTALAIAERNVWSAGLPGFKNGKFKYQPKWLWSSKTHRVFGTLAYTSMLLAVASGLALTPYGKSLPLQRPALIAILITALAMFRTPSTFPK